MDGWTWQVASHLPVPLAVSSYDRQERSITDRQITRRTLWSTALSSTGWTTVTVCCTDSASISSDGSSLSRTPLHVSSMVLLSGIASGVIRRINWQPLHHELITLVSDWSLLLAAAHLAAGWCPLWFSAVCGHLTSSLLTVPRTYKTISQFSCWCWTVKLSVHFLSAGYIRCGERFTCTAVVGLAAA